MAEKGPMTEPGASGWRKDLTLSRMPLFWMGLTVLGWMTEAP